ncbi:MAG TPA: MlaD family protein, partial [Baekduia sp.]|nr:MlaD family protein [Baekduia sp.]
MQKQAPSVGRIVVMVGFALSCFGLLLFLWLAFGGPVPLKPKGYRVTVSFREAGQLAQEADVRISGVTVGKVKAVDADKRTGSSYATIELQSQYAPIPKDTQATLRQKTLLGETYVELSPGSRSTGTVPDNGRLPAGQVAQTVELDEIFRAFDAKTRAAFQVWMQQLALASQGRGR